MAALYPWFVFAHILGLVVFAAAHGVSMFVAFRIRGMRAPAPIAAALEVSSLAMGPMYIGLVLLLIGGLGAAAAADLWTRPWIIASAVVLILVIAAMYMVATPYYRQVREAVGARLGDAPVAAPTVTPEELSALLDTRRPEVLLGVGGVGLVVLLWLMVLKPGG